MKLINNDEFKRKLDLHNLSQQEQDRSEPLPMDYLQKVLIKNFIFEKSNLNSFYATESLFQNCNLLNVNFYGAALNGSHFVNTIFIECSLRKSELQELILENCIFNNCDFSRSQILNSKIENSLFIDCKFNGAQIIDSIITNSIISKNSDDLAVIKDNKELNVLWTNTN